MWLNMNAHVKKHGGKIVDPMDGRSMWFRCCHAATRGDLDRLLTAFGNVYPEAAAYVRAQDQVRSYTQCTLIFAVAEQCMHVHMRACT